MATGKEGVLPASHRQCAWLQCTEQNIYFFGQQLQAVEIGMQV
jgi:hypothetical protein